MPKFQEMFKTLYAILKKDKSSFYYLSYYSVIEAVLVLVVPLASSFIINSIIAHVNISVLTLSFIVIVVFLLLVMVRLLQEYIVEKLKQKIFVQTGIQITELALKLQSGEEGIRKKIDKYMNYFFDVLSIQKTLPTMFLDGVELLLKIIVSLLLLLFFDHTLFGTALTVLFIYGIIFYFMGRGGVARAIDRSDAKHESIYYLQHIPFIDEPEEKIKRDFDTLLQRFIDKRAQSFNIILRQISLTVFMEGLIVAGFMILGAYLVENGDLPIGEFVAAEIVVVSLINAFKIVIKQIDYFYDMVEGLYKIGKLSVILERSE